MVNFAGMESLRNRIVALSLITLGMISMSAQVIIIREFLSVFQGNELTIGMILGAWMLLTGLGAILMPLLRIRPGTGLASIMLMLLGIMPGMMFWLLALAKGHLLPPGAAPGIREIIFMATLVVAPFCLVSGMLFPLLARKLSDSKLKDPVAGAYALDSAGSIIGGLAFSLFFIIIFNNHQILFILAIAGLLAALGLAGSSGNRSYPALVILLATLYAMFLFMARPESLPDRLMFRGQEVLDSRITPFGKLTVTRSDEQLNLFENSVPVISGENVIAREESVHFALALHPSPAKVLMISGGVGGTLDEVLKHPVDRLDYLEINPWLISLAEKYRLLERPERVNIIHQDPRIFLNRKQEGYDMILVNAPSPSSAELNRYFTLEFYELIKSRMSPGAILSVSIPAAGNYMNEASRGLHSVTWHTLHRVFSHVRIVPGEKDYFLASDSDLSQSILAGLEARGIENRYVNPYYFREDLAKARSELITRDLHADPVINRDLRPYSYLQSLNLWMSQFAFDGRIILFSLMGMVLLAFIFFGPLNLGLFAGGFTSSSVVFLLMIWMQVVYGFIYQMTGVVFAVFMTGLAIGSQNRLLFYKNSTFRGFLTIQAAIGAFCILLAAVIHFIPSSTNWTVILLILILVAGSGLLTGIHFSLSACLRKSGFLQSSGEAFSADLIGSAIGIGLVAVYVMPYFGLVNTALALGLLNTLALGVVSLHKPL